MLKQPILAFRISKIIFLIVLARKLLNPLSCFENNTLLGCSFDLESNEEGGVIFIFYCSTSCRRGKQSLIVASLILRNLYRFYFFYRQNVYTRRYQLC